MIEKNPTEVHMISNVIMTTTQIEALHLAMIRDLARNPNAEQVVALEQAKDILIKAAVAAGYGR